MSRLADSVTALHRQTKHAISLNVSPNMPHSCRSYIHAYIHSCFNFKTHSPVLSQTASGPKWYPSGTAGEVFTDRILLQCRQSSLRQHTVSDQIGKKYKKNQQRFKNIKWDIQFPLSAKFQSRNSVDGLAMRHVHHQPRDRNQRPRYTWMNSCRETRFNENHFNAVHEQKAKPDATMIWQRLFCLRD